MQFNYKQIPYEQLDRATKINKGKVVLNNKDWRMVRDYILFLEGALHIATNQTFGSIPEEMIRYLGEEKVKKYYGTDAF